MMPYCDCENMVSLCEIKVKGHHLMCCSYLRLKFSSVSEAAKAVDLLKEYKREGQELNIKFFADDDSEGVVYLFFL